MLKTSASLLLLLTVAASSFAAIQPPAPRPLAPAELSPAAYRQGEPDTAWTGENFVAVWADQRKTQYWRYGFGPAIFASRVSSDGNVLDRMGIEVAARGTNPKIASNERGSLVTYIGGDASSYALPLGDDARPSGPAVNLGALEVWDIATNGAGYCAVGNRWPATNKALLLNAKGNVVQSIDIEGSPTAVAAIDGVYIVISTRGRDLLATTVLANRPTVTKTIATVDSGEPMAVALAGDNRVLVAWRNVGGGRQTYAYVLLDSAANLIGEPRSVFGTFELPYDNIGEPSLGWDGELFLFAWEQSDDRQFGVRIRSNGTTVFGTVELPARMSFFSSAHSGNSALVVSVEPKGYSSDVLVRAVPSFRTLPDLPPANMLALSARPQMQPSVAYGGNVAMAVSLEGEGPESISATLFSPRGTTPAITRVIAAHRRGVEKEGASVAVTRNLFLVAWREMENFSTRIMAQRVDESGVPLPGTIVLAEEPLFVYFGETSIATDGDTFLVVWDSPSKEILARRVRMDGTLVDASPIVVSRNPGRENHDLENPEVMWTGSEYLVAWSEHEHYQSAPPAGMTRIRGARITRDGTLLDSGDSKTFFARPGHPTGVDLAMNDTGLLVTASFGSYIDLALKFVDALPLDRAANPTLAAPIRLDRNPADARLVSAAAAGVGDAFFVFWGEQGDQVGDVRGARIGRTGDVELFDVAHGNAFTPAATSFGGDIVLVQSQHDAARSNVVRLFSTTFSPEEAATPRRQRVARP